MDDKGVEKWTRSGLNDLGPDPEGAATILCFLGIAIITMLMFLAFFYVMLNSGPGCIDDPEWRGFCKDIPAKSNCTENEFCEIGIKP